MHTDSAFEPESLKSYPKSPADKRKIIFLYIVWPAHKKVSGSLAPQATPKDGTMEAMSFKG